VIEHLEPKGISVFLTKLEDVADFDAAG